MYSQSDERCILDVLEIKISFAAQPWWEDFYFFFKFLFVDFTLWWWYLCKFLEKRKKVKFYKFLLLPLPGILETSER